MKTVALGAQNVPRSGWTQPTQNRILAAMKRIVRHYPQLERLVPEGSMMALIL